MADISKIKLPSNTIYDVKDTVARNGLNGKQDTLVSGTNIKTINNQSLLGSGNIPISSDGNYFIDIDNWTSQNYVELEDAIRTGKYLYIGQGDEQTGEIIHIPVTYANITEDSEIICYYIEDDTVHMYTFHSDGTYYYEYHYLQRKLTAGSGIEINSNNVISATGLSSATNWLNGSQTGSVRTSGSKEEDSNYTIGQYAVAEGRGTHAQGNYSHTEGYDSYAIGAVSHAEGNEVYATGNCSHAEGQGTEATGNCSHAEGNYVLASGEDSHAQNKNTIAQRKSQTAIGEFNIADTTGADGTVRGQYAFIIGNGTNANNRSNALTVDWDGNIELALDTTAASGTTDGDLYAAITALGWQSDVID